MIALRTKIHIRKAAGGKRVVEGGPAPAPVIVPEGRVPRVARLMALAIRYDRLIKEGKVRDQSELARAVGVTQPRITQIMNLLLLAPDIQESLLALPRVAGRIEALTERHLRRVAAEPDWELQRHRMCVIHGGK